ncbi:MAG: hypothetical protein ACOCZK_00325, partial [Planctomycetota bacterium]
MTDTDPITALQRRFAHLPGVELTRLDGGLICCRLQGEAGSGAFLLQGGQLWSWAPRGQRDLLWQTAAVPPRPGQSPYGGVPVCWPWLGVAPRADLPFHGLVRLHPWHLESIEPGAGGGFRVVLGTDHRAAPVQTQPFALRLEFTLGAAARVSLEVTNTGEQALESGGALHSYLRIGDRRRIRLHGLTGQQYRGEVDEPLLVDEGDGFEGQAQWSRNYYDPDGGPVRIRVADPALERTLVLEREGSSTLTLWNPGEAGAQRIDGIGDAQWPQFVCLEAGNIHRRAVRLAPGARHLLTS